MQQRVFGSDWNSKQFRVSSFRTTTEGGIDAEDINTRSKRSGIGSVSRRIVRFNRGRLLNIRYLINGD